MSAKIDHIRNQRGWWFCALLLTVPLIAGCGGSGSSSTQQQQQQQQQPTQLQPSADPTGQLQTFSTSGGVDFNSDFFDNLGTNGRKCSSCHQANDGWTMTPPDLQARFNSSNGTDPVFRLVYGSDCPDDDVSTVTAEQAAYSQLLARGVIRVSRPIPANADFSLAGYDDPYNCVAKHGLSLYRRPLPATNLKFEVTIMFDGRFTLPGEDLFHDLEAQASDATRGHAQASAAPTSAQLADIVNFESALFTAQTSDSTAGALNTASVSGGPMALSQQSFTPGENNIFSGSFNQNVFTLYTAWESVTGSDAASQMKASIARGEKLFNTRVINISGVAGFNDKLGKSPVAGSCSSCHSTPNVGNLSINDPMNIGTVAANRRTPDMPLYTFLCNNATETQVMDPGFALTTGKCADIGRFKVPVLRGLAARAPYFHDGQATGLIDVVNFYNTRFDMQMTDQEKTDLVNFLSSL